MHAIFISFAIEDRSIAEVIRTSLETNGFRCWIAPRDIPDGVPYAAAIVEGIRSAKALLVLLTANSRSSPHVLREVECAISANCSIATLQLYNTEPDAALAYYLGPTQWISTTNEQMTDAMLGSAWVAGLQEPARSMGEKAGVFPRPKVAFSTITLALLSSGMAVLLMSIFAYILAPSSGRLRENLIAAQNRSIIIVMIAFWIVFGTTAAELIERYRSPYHPLRGRNISSHLVAALLLSSIGAFLWCMMNPRGVSHFFVSSDGSEEFALPPDFALQLLDTYSLVGVLQQVVGYPSGVADFELRSLGSLFSTSLVLGGVALALERTNQARHHDLLVAAVITALPFISIKTYWGFWWIEEDPYRVPTWTYWLFGVLACSCSAFAIYILKERRRSAQVKQINIRPP